MRINISAMLERLQDQTTSDNQYLQQSLIEYSDDVLDDGEYNETVNPIMDKTLEEAGAEGIRVLANFTPEGFEVIREQAEIAMTSRWKEGRGRKSATSSKDAFFITLTVLKHYQSYATFVWGEKLYDDIQRLTFALTNFHVTLLPLRVEDNDHYRAVMARYKNMTAENASKQAASQRRYLQRRAERFATETARANRTVRDAFLSPMASGRR
ncbi:hypothetical protein DYB32_010600 [Aphanomyces invadans]|uniref:Uncharacterized protein n=1 Tax=Aphanomyces invadans TaxID=157072 RepID=A0A418AFL2_9STRA|nr:hypothetical protein DYB32_010600 [Aphanomyces invadans]